MDIKPVGNAAAQPGQRISETGNFNADVPSIAAREAAAPVQTVNAVRQAQDIPSATQLNEAVKQINDFLNKKSQAIKFSTSDNRTVLQLVNKETGEIFLQIPSEDALRIAKALAHALDEDHISSDVKGLLIQQKA